MDAQLKRGVLDALVLSVLSRGDSYGYQIIKDISGCMEISESTLYPVLKRLESAEMLAVYTVEHGGRLRKYYHITENGMRKIGDFLSEWAEMTRVYQFILRERTGEGVDKT